MKTLNSKNRNLSQGPHLLGMLFLLAGIFWLIFPYTTESIEPSSRSFWIAIASLTLGLFVVSTHSGTFISFHELKLKEYTSILGFKLGEWIDISNVSHIRLVEESYMSSNTPNGISPTLSHKVINHNILMYDTDQRLIHCIKYNKKDMALEHSEFISAQLNVKLDCFPQ